MSGVYQRNREVSEYKFFTQAIAIRVEVNKLMASSSVVPKAYRLLNAVPTVETARGIVYNVNRADCFYPNTSFNALERKRYLTLAIADCEQLMLDMQCLMDIGLPVNANRFDVEVLHAALYEGLSAKRGQIEERPSGWPRHMPGLHPLRPVGARQAAPHQRRALPRASDSEVAFSERPRTRDSPDTHNGQLRQHQGARHRLRPEAAQAPPGRPLARHRREGYILLGDFSDYFARIAHEPVKRQVAGALLDPRVVALEHRLIDAQGEVGLGLGSEPNQICAVAHPNRIDHYVTEMLRPEAYGRYMDDFYLIHESKEYLQVCLLLIGRKCAELGIELNPRKTRVVKLSRGFTWLKKRIFYTETGRIVVKPCRDSITREHRKLKKMARMVADGVMTPEQVERSYQSWRGGMKRLDAHRSVLAMDALYRSLFENLAREGGVLNAGQPEGRFKRRQALAIAENRQLKAAA